MSIVNAIIAASHYRRLFSNFLHISVSLLPFPNGPFAFGPAPKNPAFARPGRFASAGIFPAWLPLYTVARTLSSGLTFGFFRR
ncbi:hypothetical protein BDW60DRAFT_193232 [Aspergillus nidulans var. acristatus]